MTQSDDAAKTLPFDFGYFGLEDPEFLLPNMHPGQWRLARVEMANWGTFSGYQALAVDRRGLLITGSSGSGKTTLLDAVTTVLTPPRSRHLNAAARSTNTRGEDRTLYSYIRGAWRHETDESGEIASSYLRPRVATWSGILLRFENGYQEDGHDGPDASAADPATKAMPGEKQALAADRTAPASASPATASPASPAARAANEPVNLLALFHLKAGSNNRDGLSEMYVVVRGVHALSEFEPYVISGCDAGQLKRDFSGQNETAYTFKEHSTFAYHFSRLLGINGPKTLELLHKTQGAKDFGSLDDLFRRFMLDEPETFAQAAEAVDQFMALSQAHHGVVDQRQQMEHLEPLVKLDADYAEAESALERSGQLRQALDAYTDALILQFLEAQHEGLSRQADRDRQDVERLRAEFERAEWEVGQARASLSEAGGMALESANLQVLHYQELLGHVEDSRQNLQAELAITDITSLPMTLAEWEQLRRDVAAAAERATAQEAAEKDANYELFGRVDALKKTGEAINRELRHLRSAKTNIPLRLHEVREQIAAHVGIPVRDLPFAGELMSVRPEHQEWQGAIERLLGQQAKTLLVASRHARAVAEYVESVHLGLRFEYDVVPAEVEVPQKSLHTMSVARLIEVKAHKAHPEFTQWLHASLRERFNYVCVASPAELSEHAYALTIGGQIKRQNRHIKDDRYRIDDRSRWVLGDDNEEKIERLIEAAEENLQALAVAEVTASQVEKATRAALGLEKLAQTLKGADWKGYDLVRAEDDLRGATDHYNQLKKSDKRLEKMQQACTEAEGRRKLASDALAQARVDELAATRALAQTATDIQRYAERAQAAALIPEDQKKQLDRLFKKHYGAAAEGTDAINEAARHVLEDITDMGNKASGAREKAKNAAERIMHDYRQAWPAWAADLSDDFADKDAYLGRYKQIKANGLPDFEQKFLQVLHDFSQDQVTVISSTIRRAFRDVREKLNPVNRSLLLSLYSPGVHLQIEAKDSRSAQVTDFLEELSAITEGTWSEDDLASAEARYKRIAKVIERLRSAEYADRMWKQACLDTRQHVSFVAKELDLEGNVKNIHGSDAGLSGGQKQKLVVFCLAAALRYQLADEDQPIPRYGTVILDEAFDKADHNFATTAMEIFRVFGFHMVLATPLKLLQTLEPHIGEIALVDCQDDKYSTLQIVTIEGGGAAEDGAAEGGAEAGAGSVGGDAGGKPAEGAAGAARAAGAATQAADASPGAAAGNA